MTTFTVYKNNTQIYSTNYINPFYINTVQALLNIKTTYISDKLKQIHINDEVITVLELGDCIFISVGKEISYSKSVEYLKIFVDDYEKLSEEEIDIKYM